MVKFEYKGEDYYINHILKCQLDSLVFNIKDDWDFVICISGDRQVRTGKSVLATQICCYLASKLGYDYSLKDIYFDSKTMVEEAIKKPKYAINHYDEARESLSSKKFSKQFQKDLLDFFAECGQLNQIFVVVLPDFFELSEEIAVARSECLINVYRDEVEVMRDIYNEGVKIPIVKFKRGNFQFFNRYSKALLYDRAKSSRRKNYYLVKQEFTGSFTGKYGVDEEAYREKKRIALSTFKERKEEEKQSKAKDLRQIALKVAYEYEKDKNILAEKFGLSLRTIQRDIKELGLDNEKGIMADPLDLAT